MGGGSPRDGNRSCGSPIATSVMEIHVGTIRSMYGRNSVFGTKRNRLFTADLIFPCWKMEWPAHKGILKRNPQP